MEYLRSSYSSVSSSAQQSQGQPTPRMMNAHGRSSGGDFTSPSSGNGTLQSRHHLHGEDLQQQPREYQLFPQEQFTWSPIAAPRRQPSPPRFPSPESLTLDTIFNESRSLPGLTPPHGQQQQRRHCCFEFPPARNSEPVCDWRQLLERQQQLQQERQHQKLQESQLMKWGQQIAAASTADVTRAAVSTRASGQNRASDSTRDGGSTRAADRAAKRAIRCAFCYSNGASVRTCSSHALKDADGRVQCPVMRAYSCPLCGASGDWAHTISHCPTAREPQRKQILHTHRLSSGKMNSKYRHR